MDFGSDIDFDGEAERNGYIWIASCNPITRPETITFRKHPFWKKRVSKKFINRVIHCCSHETLHSLMWNTDLHDGCRQLDVGRKGFLNMLHEEGVPDSELKEIVLGI